MPQSSYWEHKEGILVNALFTFPYFSKFAFLFNVILPLLHSCFLLFMLDKEPSSVQVCCQQMVWMIFFAMIINRVMTIRIHIQTLNWELINKPRLKFPSGLISVLNQNGFSDLVLGLLNAWKGVYSEITVQASLCEKREVHGHHHKPRCSCLAGRPPDSSSLVYKEAHLFTCLP